MPEAFSRDESVCARLCVCVRESVTGVFSKATDAIFWILICFCTRVFLCLPTVEAQH